MDSRVHARQTHNASKLDEWMASSKVHWAARQIGEGPANDAIGGQGIFGEDEEDSRNDRRRTLTTKASHPQDNSFGVEHHYRSDGLFRRRELPDGTTHLVIPSSSSSAGRRRERRESSPSSSSKTPFMNGGIITSPLQHPALSYEHSTRHRERSLSAGARRGTATTTFANASALVSPMITHATTTTTSLISPHQQKILAQQQRTHDADISHLRQALAFPDPPTDAELLASRSWNTTAALRYSTDTPVAFAMASRARLTQGVLITTAKDAMPIHQDANAKMLRPKSGNTHQENSDRVEKEQGEDGSNNDTHTHLSSSSHSPRPVTPRQRNMHIHTHKIDGARPRIVGREKIYTDGGGSAAGSAGLTHVVISAGRRNDNTEDEDDDANAYEEQTGVVVGRGRAPANGTTKPSSSPRLATQTISPRKNNEQSRHNPSYRLPMMSPIRNNINNNNIDNSTNGGTTTGSVSTSARQRSSFTVTGAPGAKKTTPGSSYHAASSPSSSPLKNTLTKKLMKQTTNLRLPIVEPPVRGGGGGGVVGGPEVGQVQTRLSSKKPALHVSAATPSQIRVSLEQYRQKQNDELLHLMGLEEGVESMRHRLVAQAGTRTERNRLHRMHAVQRQDARSRILRIAVTDEMQTVEKLRSLGIHTFAKLADAFQ